MTLKERIAEDLKVYMKTKDTVSLNAVRMLKSDVKNAEIEAMKELDDDGVVKVIRSGIKKRKDSAEIYSQNNRKDLADKELEEIKALEKYLPSQMDDEKIKETVKGVMAEMDEEKRKNFGLVMKATMVKIQGAADGKIVSEIVKGLVNGCN